MVKRAAIIRRTLVFCLIPAFGPQGFSQASGINLTLQYAHAIVDGDKGIVPSATFGLGFQRDFQKRLGMGLDLNYAARDASNVRAIEMIYSAKYFAADNDGTACYIGSFIGVQSFSGTGSSSSGDIAHLQFPIGLRAGVRGGLEGYFGEVFTHVGYAIGNGTLQTNSAGNLSSEPLYFGLGFSFLGFGWE